MAAIAASPRRSRCSAAEIVAEVTESGLRGRGGAGFPTGIKWKTVLDAQADQKYIVCNADEGDSGTFADRMIMEGDPFLLIEGMTIAGIAVGATKGFIYIRSEYPDAFARCAGRSKRAQGRLSRRQRARLAARPSISRRALGAGAYICGEETSLLEQPRRQARRHPSEAAAARHCRACSASRRSSTTCSPSPACRSSSTEGAAFYKNYGMGRSRGTQPFQLAGNIKQGGLVEKAFGLTLNELIYDFGGGT